MRRAVGFIIASSAAPAEASHPAAEHQMDRDDIGHPEQLVLRDERGADFSPPLGREILAPGDDLHPESVADLRHRTADVAETQEPERPPGHVIADRPLPSAAATMSAYI
jgi:hypothetical protein